MNRQISWDEFRLVKAIADAQGLNGAAEKLALNHSTVFRRLNGLEEDLGARLFERGRTAYVLTPAGEEMVLLARKMAEDITDFERRISGRDLQPTGEISVTMTDTMMTYLMADPLSAFRKRYPEITLNISIENRALNLSQRDADVALRASNTPPETLVGRRLGHVAWAIYGAKSIAEVTFRDPLSPSNSWVGFGEPLQNNPAARWMKAHLRDDQVGVRVNSMQAMSEAVAVGLGLGLMPCFVGEARQDLQRIGEPVTDASSTLWLLTHPDLKGAARIRAFLDFIAQEVGKLRKRIECSYGEENAPAPSLAG
jgi:DNA-binding transcriptional LysR family regulator